jgi:hypothetical protein
VVATVKSGTSGNDEEEGKTKISDEDLEILFIE